MNLDAETKYVLGLITNTPSNGRRLIWRGYLFWQYRTDTDHWETWIEAKPPKVINWGSRRLTNLEWAQACLASVERPHPWWYVTSDGVPPEIHAIEDFDAYMSALIAYKAAILR